MSNTKKPRVAQTASQLFKFISDQDIKDNSTLGQVSFWGIIGYLEQSGLLNHWGKLKKGPDMLPALPKKFRPTPELFEWLGRTIRELNRTAPDPVKAMIQNIFGALLKSNSGSGAQGSSNDSAS
jgi:hypothetical protein